MYLHKADNEKVNSMLVKKWVNITPVKKKYTYFSKEEMKFLNCKAFVKNKTAELQKYVNHGRLKIDETAGIDLDMDCVPLRKRLHGDIKKFKPLKRRIAFLRNVYRFYEQQEVFLSTSYHPENVYCYAIDVKSNEKFKSKMRSLAPCFRNVHVLENEYDFDSKGLLQDRAHVDCLKKVMHRKWNHAVLIQNDDMIMKSVYQIANLSETIKNVSLITKNVALKFRFDTSVYFSPAALELFKNESAVPDDILYKEIEVKKNTNQVMLARPFVDSIFEKLNLDNIIDFFDDKRYYGVDEMLFATLYYNQLGLDAQIESNCSRFYMTKRFRYVIWNYQSNPNPQCFLNATRHSVCLLSVEYLPWIVNSPAVVANKVLSYHDFGTVLCMKELIRRNEVSPEPNSEQLMAWPQYKEMVQKTSGTYNKTTFRC